MGVKITGVDTTALRLEALTDQYGDRARRALEQGAKDVQELARRQAPVDEGNLEAAIKLDHDYQGVNRRKRFFVYIDENMPVPGKPDKRVGDYSVLMHENLAPYGTFQLGPLSEEKQSANPDVIVGGKFLERAGDELADEITERVRKALGL
jgi:hypothetical protein